MLQKANRYPRHGDFEEFTAEAESESPEYSAALASSSQSVTEVRVIKSSFQLTSNVTICDHL